METELLEVQRVVNIRLPARLHRELRVKAAEQDTSIRALVEQMVREALERECVGQAAR